jgi:Lipocalin-like domain
VDSLYAIAGVRLHLSRPPTPACGENALVRADGGGQKGGSHEGCPNQELRVSFTYWEVTVQVKGNKSGKTIVGSGYVELTRYAQSIAGQF